MKILVLLLGFNLIILTNICAQNRFNLIYPETRWNCNIIKDIENNYVINGWGTNLNSLMKTNYLGQKNFLNILQITDTLFAPGWCNSIIQNKDSSYIQCGTIQWFDSNLNGGTRLKCMLLKYSQDGILQFKKYFGGDTIRKILQGESMILKDDSTIYVTGFLTHNQSPGSAFNHYLAKLDTAGNLLWDKVWWQTPSEGTSSITTINNSLYLGSFYCDGVNSWLNLPHSAPLFQKLDTAGNVLIRKKISGRTFTDATFGSLYARKPSSVNLPDALVGWFQLDTTLSNGKWLRSVPLLYGLDTNLNILWEKTIFREKLLVPRNITTLSNNRTMLYGMQYLDDKNQDGDGWAILFDANQNIIWERTFHYRDKAVHYFTGVTECPDGGFVFCGSVFKTADTSTKQSGWLVKTDSMGCIDNAACFPMSVSTLVEQALEISCYPNPASDYLNINIEGGNNNEAINYEIINTEGKILAKNNVYLNSKSTKIDISNLPNAVYLLSIFQNNKHYRQSFIKN
jgi:hypothetical protein